MGIAPYGSVRQSSVSLRADRPRLSQSSHCSLTNPQSRYARQLLSKGAFVRTACFASFLRFASSATGGAQLWNISKGAFWGLAHPSGEPVPPWVQGPQALVALRGIWGVQGGAKGGNRNPPCSLLPRRTVRRCARPVFRSSAALHCSRLAYACPPASSLSLSGAPTPYAGAM